MELLLRPGMRLMRRLAVAGKFGLIAVLLLLPLCITMVTGFRDSTEQIALAERERDGLVCVTPLVRLVVELSQSRNLALSGRRPGDTWVGITRELDGAVERYGTDFDIERDWARLRSEVESLYDPGNPLPNLAEQAGQAARTAQALIQQVADSSTLTVDPQLDSHYLARVLVDDLPRLVTTAADAQALRGGDEDAPDPLELGASSSDLAEAARQLRYDLITATSSTQWAELGARVSADAGALNSAVAQYSAALAAATGTAEATDQVHIANLSAAASALGATIGGTLDQRLAQRSARLLADRTQPLMLTLFVLAVVFYLLTALFRATTRDVRTVLDDISTVTNGAVHQTSPLSGSDEFGRMSRAVVYARDRLTALVGTLQYQATHDELTALANRSLFSEKVQDALSTSPRPAGHGDDEPRAAVLLVDLDSFKAVNDSFGHDLGDRLLRTIGARLHRSAPRRSVVARLGSDEFAVLVTDTRHLQVPQEIVGRLEDVLAQPVDIEGRLIAVQAGIGVALARAEDISALELIRNADVALSYAKNRGKGQSVVFEPAMHDQTRQRTELSAELVTAVERQEMKVVYQPIVDLQTGTLHGVEALLRWDHPVRGQLSPSVFVPLAEASGHITRIGRWALETACHQLATWQRAFPDAYPLVMEVNLATEQLADPGLVADVLTTLQTSGIDPSGLVLEITESSLVRDVDTAMKRLGQLSAMGVRLALDDFGTGYSSLSYLLRLPVTVLKIDKSFVSDDSSQGHALLSGIADLGSGQGMQIIVEGVETAQQARFVRESGCHLGQGHHWAPAMSADEVTRIIAGGGRIATMDDRWLSGREDRPRLIPRARSLDV